MRLRSSFAAHVRCTASFMEYFSLFYDYEALIVLFVWPFLPLDNPFPCGIMQA